MKLRIKHILPMLLVLCSCHVLAQEQPEFINNMEKTPPRKFYVKTNAASWLLAISNLAIEADLAQHWSFSLPVSYAAWNYFSSSIKFRTLSFYPEMRYWASAENDGWFAGVHYGMAWYNFCIDKAYRTQDKGGHTPAVGGGATVGYRLPLSKNNRWKMELSLGIGVYRLHQDKFLNKPNGAWCRTERKCYFGPDQLSLSFAYMFDMKKRR